MAIENIQRTANGCFLSNIPIETEAAGVNIG
jgi:hypothetical protein